MSGPQRDELLANPGGDGQLRQRGTANNTDTIISDNSLCIHIYIYIYTYNVYIMYIYIYTYIHSKHSNNAIIIYSCNNTNSRSLSLYTYIYIYIYRGLQARIRLQRRQHAGPLGYERKDEK